LVQASLNPKTNAISSNWDSNQNHKNFDQKVDNLFERNSAITSAIKEPLTQNTNLKKTSGKVYKEDAQEEEESGKMKKYDANKEEMYK
jgi:hypothetical protein